MIQFPLSIDLTKRHLAADVGPGVDVRDAAGVLVARIMPLNGGYDHAAELMARLERSLPMESTPWLDDILGQSPMMTTRIAHLFRETGEDIPPKMEREHAFVMFWMLGLALKHGANWRPHAAKIIDERIAAAKKLRLIAAFPNGVPDVSPSARKVLEMLGTVKHAEMDDSMRGLSIEPLLAQRCDENGVDCMRITPLGRIFLECTPAA